MIFRLRKVSLRVLLSFCLIFSQFQPGIAYNSVAYEITVLLMKKRVIQQ